MKLNKYIGAVLLTTIFCSAFAQFEESYTSEEPYYLFPIKPGVRNTLAGTMGELRSSHFHTGLDIRTEGRIGLPVQSSADGYISRVAVSPYGYGNALYVTHPNGNTTVYAHLDEFEGPIAEYVKKEQYRRKSASLNLYFHKDRFTVKKGEIIALSGNSGSSGGPHLHYDIRDANNNPINPLEYGFNEILDNTPPVAQKVAIKTLDKYSRVNGQFGRAEFTVRRIGNNYVIDQPIEVYGNVGIELYAYDKLDNARFRCGITTIKMNVDDETLFSQNIEKLSFAKQRNILVHMDYPELLETGHRYHKLYIDDGNELNFYSATHSGKLNLQSDCEKTVKVSMQDSYKNISYLEFKLKCKTPDHTISGSNVNSKDAQLVDNTLVLSQPAREQNTLEVFTPEKQTIPAAYVLNGQTAVYLWDMKEGLPFSVKAAEGEHILNYQSMVTPSSSYDFYSKNINIDFRPHVLFDTLYMQSSYAYDSIKDLELFTIGDTQVPLKKNITVWLKPEKHYDDQDKFDVYAIDERGRMRYEGGSWSDGRIKFYTRNFGTYTIASDTVPPRIIPVKTNSNSLMFKILDDLSGINKYECKVNGQWVLMHYDYKRSLIWSEKLDDETYKGEVKLTLTDNADNTTEYIVEL